MRVETLIRHRTQEKEIRLSGELVMRKPLGNSAAGFITARLERLQITEQEFKNCKDFAMFQDCYMEHCLKENGKQVRPCLPVFYRGIMANEDEN